MKLSILSTAIFCVYLIISFLSCSSVYEQDEKRNRYIVNIQDKNGKTVHVTKGSSILPTGSTVTGTGYYADGDNYTLNYTPASGYFSKNREIYSRSVK